MIIDAQPLTAERLAEIEQITQAVNCFYPGTREGYFALRDAQYTFLERGTEAIADLLCEVNRLRAELHEIKARLNAKLGLGKAATRVISHPGPDLKEAPRVTEADRLEREGE